MISPSRKRHYTALLDEEPLTALETQLQDALRESKGQNDKKKTCLSGMQAETVLFGMYVVWVCGQLEGQEAEAVKKKSVRILQDRYPKLLTGDTVFKLVTDNAEATDERQAVKDARRVAREAHGAAIAEWKTEDGRRK
ncbi:hypothetical protein C8Q72DRAFT_925972, partial [Fomitopsis betulina]